MKYLRCYRPLLPIALLACTIGSGLAANQAGRLPVLPVAPGPFQPAWQSLTNYQCPDWFRDAKFGIWAHWGAPCVAEVGGWYARNLYVQGSPDYQRHLQQFGHPSTNGFKDVIHVWKAERFDPEKLLAFYKENGAKYFMALANHHDNFDNWKSRYQPWNSVNEGPHQDIIGAWVAAARKEGLRFAVSVHSGRAWSWYETAQGSDTNGPLAEVPYDGRLTTEEGEKNDLWWSGLNPQDLYAQNHPVGQKLVWGPKSTPAELAYVTKFYQRTRQLWDDYRPDLIYFDDVTLPLHGASDDIGLRLAAHFYNSSIQSHGQNEAVMTCKKLTPQQRQALVYDIERGKAEGILPEPWQTDTCIGSWFHSQSLYERHGYKTAATVIPMLADIVSKNGNLMLSVPLRADGTLDEDEVKIVSDIGAWLKINGEAIYGTRPWKVYGEGPSTTQKAEPGRFGGQSDTQSEPFTAQDIRFTQSKDGRTLYAILLGWPADGKVTLRSLAAHAVQDDEPIEQVELLGASQPLVWHRTATGLDVTLPVHQTGSIAYALKIQR